MTRKLSFERYRWFYKQAKENQFPNAFSLAKKFEISTKTAQRDIEFMRDRIAAPLEYDVSQKGYYCSDKNFELPPVWLRSDEIIAYILAERIATAIPDETLKASLKTLIEKICIDSDINIQDIQQKFSLTNIRYSPIDSTVFNDVVNALINEQSLQITYHSPYQNSTSSRKIYPLHLLDYRGSWYLVAWCHSKQEMRKFMLSRIVEHELIQDIPKPIFTVTNIKDYLRENFGLFSGETKYIVKAKFYGNAADLAMEQIWHKNQIVTKTDDGSIVLEIPVSELDEIRNELMSFGSFVEVLEPLELKNQILLEAKKMCKLYL
ncbi:MAG: YafY family protein [Candidatus Theseobacter exili]|nr:YafY family protein [Candidatus Theseobacter exili]